MNLAATGAIRLGATGALAVVAAATGTRRAVTMGLAIVLGVAGGLGVGAVRDHPEAALVVAALASGAALVTVLAQVAAEPLPIAPPTRRAGVGRSRRGCSRSASASSSVRCRSRPRSSPRRGGAGSCSGCS